MNTDSRVYELRRYDAVPGRINDLVGRFRDHAADLFEKHGMKNIGFWVELDEGKQTETLVYLVSHASQDAAAASWAAFWEDPEWTALQATGERVTASATTSFLEPTDFSPLS